MPEASISGQVAAAVNPVIVRARVCGVERRHPPSPVKTSVSPASIGGRPAGHCQRAGVAGGIDGDRVDVRIGGIDRLERDIGTAADGDRGIRAGSPRMIACQA